VDIVTEVAPADAERVERSGHARLVPVDEIRAEPFPPSCRP